MRLWPYQMLDVLPSRQLVSQWRECLAVSGIIRYNKSHYIIDRVKYYNLSHFIVYCQLVEKEFIKRDYKIGTNALETLDKNINFSILKEKINYSYNNDYNLYDFSQNFVKNNKLFSINNIEYIIVKNNIQDINNIIETNQILFENWHNERYLRQCLYSFQEKYDCNGISEETWLKIYNKFKYIIDF